ncbi:hypothetical protein DY000_02014711 [Brassica cretica]|uniref:Uncharacterized protein n=1 Tax=Brassica cretica TaxID=69181 RepID=A0ABQ7D674_BRACR|nr:hypothetical protein DY000_02014711 [Brassica cretica]
MDIHHRTWSDARAETGADFGYLRADECKYRGTSINRRQQPIDGLFEFGKRAYDFSGNKIFKWERRDEYGVYRDEHGYARAPDGRIIHVSKKDIREILERATMHEQANISLPEHAAKFTRTLPKLGSYKRADIDDMVHGIYRAQEMSLEESYRRLDDVYYTLNDSVERLTTRMDELKEEMDVIRRQAAVRSEASIDGSTRPSIEGSTSTRPSITRPSIDGSTRPIDNRHASL